MAMGFLNLGLSISADHKALYKLKVELMYSVYPACIENREHPPVVVEFIAFAAPVGNLHS